MGGSEALIIELVVRLAFAGICAGVASSKGRSALGWFFLGLIFTCIPMIIILCLSNKKEADAKWQAQDLEQQRLREQLRQEQIKNEALRQHTIARLDQHDQSLGIDTRQTAPLLGHTPDVPVAPAANLEFSAGNEPPPPPGFPTDNWYVDNNGEQDGPYAWVVVYRRARQGTTGCSASNDPGCGAPCATQASKHKPRTTEDGSSGGGG